MPRPIAPTHQLADFLYRAAQGERVELEWPSPKREDGSQLAVRGCAPKSGAQVARTASWPAFAMSTERRKIAAEQRRLARYC